MTESAVGWISHIAGTPYLTGVFVLLGWLRWSIGAVALVGLLLGLVMADARAHLPHDDLPVAIIVGSAACATAAGAWIDRILRGAWGGAHGQPAGHVPLLRPLHPHGLHALPAFVAALLCACLAGYAIYLSSVPFDTERAAFAYLAAGFAPGMSGSHFFDAYMYFSAAATLFLGAFVALRELRMLYLPWFAAAGAVNGLVVSALIGVSPASALVGIAVGVAGGIGGYLELRHRVESHARPMPKTTSVRAPPPRAVPQEPVAARAIRNAVHSVGSTIASGYRFACDAMGAKPRARAIAALSLAFASASAVFAAFGRSVLFDAGFAAEDVAWPATVAAAIVALLAYFVTSVVVARLVERASQRVALLSLVVAMGGIAIFLSGPCA